MSQCRIKLTKLIAINRKTMLLHNKSFCWQWTHSNLYQYLVSVAEIRSFVDHRFRRNSTSLKNTSYWCLAKTDMHPCLQKSPLPANKWSVQGQASVLASRQCLVKIVLFFFFWYFCLFRAASPTYGGSQARCLIRATAAGLCQSCSHARAKPCLWPSPQLMATLDA